MITPQSIHTHGVNVHPECFGCYNEVPDNMGGPDVDNPTCLKCEDADMFNMSGYNGRFIAG